MFPPCPTHLQTRRHPWEVQTASTPPVGGEKRIKDSKMKESKLCLIFDHCWQRERGQATHASSAGLRPFADPAAKTHQIASRSRQAHSRHAKGMHLAPSVELPVSQNPSGPLSPAPFFTTSPQRPNNYSQITG